MVFCGECPQAIAPLLSWPKALSDVTIACINHFGALLDYSMLHSWLIPHAATLKTLCLGAFSPLRQDQLFRAADFPSLEALTLSRWQMEEDLCHPAQDAEVLLGPKLEYFGWDFTVMEECWSECYTNMGNHFSSREEEWLRQVLRQAIAKQTPLKRVVITFNVSESTGECCREYPWDRMEKLNSEFTPHGIMVEYSEPPITRDEWLKSVAPFANEREHVIDRHGVLATCGAGPSGLE